MADVTLWVHLLVVGALIALEAIRIRRMRSSSTNQIQELAAKRGVPYEEAFNQIAGGL